VSSHHVVKEDQEPALLILDSSAISFEKTQELLEWSPTVIVAEDQLPEVIRWGIKIDIVLCLRSNRMTLNEYLLNQLPLRFICYDYLQNKLEVVLKFLVAEKYKATNVLAQSTSDLHIAQTMSGITIGIFVKNQKWSWITKHSFEKWVSAGTSLSVFPSTTRVSTTGLSQDLKCLIDGIVSIQSKEEFWIGEYLS
jgi:thiamine pyrophosphokinase